MVLFYSNRVIVLVKFTEFVSFVIKREKDYGGDNGLVRKKSKNPRSRIKQLWNLEADLTRL